jgi:hypothetical protein
VRPILTPSTIQTAFTPHLKLGKEVPASSAKMASIRTRIAIAPSADSLDVKIARLPTTARSARRASLRPSTRYQNCPSASTATIGASQRLPRRAPTITKIARTAWWMTKCASRNAYHAPLASSSQMQLRRRKNV